MLPLRPVEENWSCKRSGDCCTQPLLVTMTTEERELIEKSLEIRKLVQLTWVEDEREGFVHLVAKPCPLHAWVAGKSTCTIHSIRPYNCRRFGCMRPNPAEEPFQLAPVAPVLKYGTIGCSNLRERLVSSRIARRAYQLMQRKAQRWARAHGWKG